MPLQMLHHKNTLGRRTMVRWNEGSNGKVLLLGVHVRPDNDLRLERNRTPPRIAKQDKCAPHSPPNRPILSPSSPLEIVTGARTMCVRRNPPSCFSMVPSSDGLKSVEFSLRRISNARNVAT